MELKKTFRDCAIGAAVVAAGIPAMYFCTGKIAEAGVYMMKQGNDALNHMIYPHRR